MTSQKQTIEYLENERKALNERLMNSKTVNDAVKIDESSGL